MQPCSLTLKNYRCFPDRSPATLSLGKGFTALIGVNNSGKSSLLKFFFEFRDLFQRLSSAGGYQPGLQGDRRSFNPSGVYDVSELFNNTNDRGLEIIVALGEGNTEVRADYLPSPNGITIAVPRNGNEFSFEMRFPDGSPIEPNASIGVAGTELVNLPSGCRTDIGVWFEVFRTLSRTVYVGAFRNAINVGGKEDYFDLHVGQAFIKGWRQLKTGDTKSDNEAIYRLTDDIRRIFGFRTLEIDASANEETLQLLVNGKSYKLREVGSGLAQFVLALGNVAIQQPAYVLIDEPELNLHPSLQLDFLTTLGSYATEGVVFSTHSIGLARSAADRIYALKHVREGETAVSDFERTSGLSEFLGELSFSGYQELGFDKVLLVEGRTDVKTVQQFLRLYGKDHEVVLLPLGGRQMICGDSEAELIELMRITNNVSALIDSERPRADAPLEAPRDAFVAICEKLALRCHVLERRAIENYLSDAAVRAVKGDKYVNLDPYQKLSEAPQAWSKDENWRIAREMARDDLDSTDLGRFLQSL